MYITTHNISDFYRYESFRTVHTPLNPIEDLICWISGLNSTEYNSDILRKIHNFQDKTEIKESSKNITLFANNAIGLIEQAYSGPQEVSYLPLYYSILNLSKIYIITAGLRNKLTENRYHGAKYDPNQSHQKVTINEHIEIKLNGMLPLFYFILTGKNLYNITRKINLSEIYPYIPSISHEYSHALNEPSPIRQVQLHIHGGENNKFRIVANLYENDHPNAFDKKYLKLLSGFKSNSNGIIYTSKNIIAKNKDEARRKFISVLRTYLIYEPIINPSNSTIDSFLTPINNKRLLLPEEIPIWFTFFHLSNVVRYNPELLYKLKDTKYWPMLLALRKHTILRFLILFWSNFHRSHFCLYSG
ncbi:MAG: hypothetical protein JXI43_11725 [Tissierellales bacterium]|nr:hypothetical protein [Tissierellales bacterium]